MARTLARLCEGQIAEVQGSDGALPPDVPRLAPTLEHYLEVVSGKTASLIATSCRYGALLSGVDDRRAWRQRPPTAGTSAWPSSSPTTSSTSPRTTRTRARPPAPTSARECGPCRCSTPCSPTPRVSWRASSTVTWATTRWSGPCSCCGLRRAGSRPGPRRGLRRGRGHGAGGVRRCTGGHGADPAGRVRGRPRRVTRWRWMVAAGWCCSCWSSPSSPRPGSRSARSTGRWSPAWRPRRWDHRAARPLLPQLLLGRARDVEVVATGVRLGDLRVDDHVVALPVVELPWGLEHRRRGASRAGREPRRSRLLTPVPSCGPSPPSACNRPCGSSGGEVVIGRLASVWMPGSSPRSSPSRVALVPALGPPSWWTSLGLALAVDLPDGVASTDRRG
jgi:hypothetical protein